MWWCASPPPRARSSQHASAHDVSSARSCSHGEDPVDPRTPPRTATPAPHTPIFRWRTGACTGRSPWPQTRRCAGWGEGSQGPGPGAGRAGPLTHGGVAAIRTYDVAWAGVGVLDSSDRREVLPLLGIGWCLQRGVPAQKAFVVGVCLAMRRCKARHVWEPRAIAAGCPPLLVMPRPS